MTLVDHCNNLVKIKELRDALSNVETMRQAKIKYILIKWFILV